MPPVQGFDVFCPSSQLNQPYQPSNPVAVGLTAVKLMDANQLRKEFIIANTGTTVIAIGFGPNPSITNGQFVVLLAGGSSSRDGTGGTFVSDMWQGQVWAISSAVSGEIVLTEMV